MTDLARLATRIFGAPLLMERGQLDTILATIGPRFGFSPATAPKAMDQEDETRERGQRRPYRVTPSGVAVVPIVGALVSRAGQITPDCAELRSYAAIRRDLTAAIADPTVRGIVLDIDSPGGEAANVMELSAEIAALRGRKPIVAAVNSSAYSAAYAIASAADRIVIPRTAGVGSVGVVAVHVDRSREDERAGRSYTWIAAGARKLDGNPHAPLTEGAHGVITAEVDRLYGIFVEQVAQNRASKGLTADAVRASEAGLFFGENAVAAGFADEIGTMDDAVRIAAGDTKTTGRGRPSARSHPKGATMDGNDQAGDASANANQNNNQPDAAAIREQAMREAAAHHAERAQAIAALCQLAGKPAKAATFIAEGKTEAEVRALLLTEQAAASAEGGEVSGSRGAAAPAGQQGSSVAVAASWDKIGRQAFGAAWKGI